MEYTLVEAETTADSLRACNTVARFSCVAGAVDFIADALREGDERATGWFLLDPAGRAIAGADDVLDCRGV